MLYSFSDFRRPTTPLAGTRRTRFAAEWNWLGPTLISTWLKLANRARYFNSSSFFVSYLPVALPDQPPNPLVDKFLQSLTDNPIQFKDRPTTSRQESRINILLPSLAGSTIHKNQSEESQSNPSPPKQLPSNLTAPETSTEDARASPSRPNQFQRNQQTRRQKQREGCYQHNQSVRRLRYNPSLHYQLTKVFSSWDIIFWDHRRQENTIQKTVLSSQRIVVPLSAIEVQPYVTEPTSTHFSAKNPLTIIHSKSPRVVDRNECIHLARYNWSYYPSQKS